MIVKNKKGFTLIELLAVIIVLGVILIIAVPSVTGYIEDSRKKTYIRSAEGYVEGVKDMIVSRDISVKRKDTTYYIPIEYIPIDKGGDSPYGDWVAAYVVVIYEDSEYKYYWTSVDETGHKISLMSIGDITPDSIIVDSTKLINNRKAIGNREKIYILESDGKFSEMTPVE